jgi:hypothetical protein
VTFAPTPRLEGIHELLGLPETQMRWRGVRGLELGNVGFWKSRPNSLVCQNIFVPKTWRGAGRGSRWGARAALAIRHFEFESSHPSHTESGLREQNMIHVNDAVLASLENIDHVRAVVIAASHQPARRGGSHDAACPP